MSAPAHPHDHDHDDAHGHTHGHSHAPADFGMAFAVGTALNLAFVLFEAGFGFAANSMALLADAGHNLSDVFGLLMAWGASALVKRRPTAHYTYGFGQTTILAALANAMLLLVATGAIIWEAAQRLWSPEPVAAWTVIAVAALGILVNGVTAWMFVAGRKDDINVRGAFLHMATDAIVTLGVVVTGFLILWTGRLWLDPLISIAIAAAIVWSTWGLLRDSSRLALQAVPPGIDPLAVRTALLGLPGVAKLHDLHIWPISTTQTALSCHLVMPSGCPDDGFIARAGEALREKFKIGHATLQVERGNADACALEPDHVV